MTRIGLCIALVVTACGGTGGPDSTVAVTTPDDTPVTTTTQPPNLEGLDAIIFERTGGENGSVIIAVFEEDESTLAAFGTDVDGRSVTPDTPWPTASLAKIFTATAILQLVESGALDLDDPVADHVDFPISEKVTVRHVLLHQSTIPNVASFAFSCPGPGTIELIKETAGKAATSTEPGKSSAYSNTNYLVLGLLIEAVTRQDPGQYMSDEIFEPLGMESTYWYESQTGPRPWWPIPESMSGVGLHDCGELGPTVGTDGAAITTVHDMDRFLRGLFGGELVRPESLEEMLVMDSKIFGFRFGLGILEMVHPGYPDTVLYGFGGSTPALTNAAFYDPDKGRSVVVFTSIGEQRPLLWKAIEWADSNADTASG